MKTSRRFHANKTSSGFSLIELLVVLLIGLVLTLAISLVMRNSEGRKREITTVNDINQTGAYLAYVLDRSIRNAGSGFSQRWTQTFGCSLNVGTGTTNTISPSNAALPAPFNKISGNIRIAPVVIGQGQSATDSDVITVMSGSAGLGEVGAIISVNSATESELRVPNTLDFRAGDLVLLTQTGQACLIQQISDDFVESSGQLLTFAGNYTGARANQSIANFGQTPDSFAISLGNPTSNPPTFQIYGVGDNLTLFSYDLLQMNGSTPLPLADGVTAMFAVYGVDNNADGKFDEWVAPSDTYASTTLLNGSAASQLLLKSVVAVRVALVLRTSLQEKKAVEQPSLTLFRGLGALEKPFPLTPDQQRFHHRIVEFTVPVRNALL